MNTQMISSPNETGHRICPWWVAYFFDNPFRRWVHPAEKVLGPYVRPGMTTLDFGCGFGHFSLGMARLAGEKGAVVAVDIQQKMLDKTMARARNAGVDHIIRPLLISGDGLGDIPELDFALVCNSLHETPEPFAVFSGLFARLKPGGALFFMEPGGHMKAKEFESEVDLALKAGFRETGRPKLWREMCVLFKKPEQVSS